MVKILDVYLNNNLTGQAIQDNNGQFLFEYDQNWLNNPKNYPLSFSLPLSKKKFKRNECRGFFSGILPEANKRQIIAKNLGVSDKNDYSLLERIGGECAGAVTFLPRGDLLDTKNNRYYKIDESKLETILKDLPNHPLMAGKEGIRLSLAGVQDKITVYIKENGQISIPINNSPSSHIIKPAIERLEGLVFNEAFCLELASICGIEAAKAQVNKSGNIDYLLVKRFDRKIESTGLKRLHQEDFCQALNIAPENKYQNEGGPSLKDCFDLIRKVSTTPAIDLQKLLNVVIFNFLIGNNDAHGKNFSILYEENKESGKKTTRLTPFYDLVSTTYYPDLSNKMAMKIGGEYDCNKITLKHFEKLSEDIGMNKLMVKKHILTLKFKVFTAVSSLQKISFKNEVICKKLAESIIKKCQKF